MPRAKRNKVISLTKVAKRQGGNATEQHKHKLFETVENAAQQFPHIYIIQLTHLRTNWLQQLREDMKPDSK
jgi:ribosomal protein L10